MASCSSSSRPLRIISEETACLPLANTGHTLLADGWDVFLSHSGEQKGFAKDLFKMLHPPYNVFFDITRFSLPLGEPFPTRILDAARTCKVAVVILSNEFFCSKWPMLELSEFCDAPGVHILPLFYELSPRDLSNEKNLQEWDKRWKELASMDSRIEVSVWANARRRLCSINGLVFKKSEGVLAYLDDIVAAIRHRVPPLFRSSHPGVFGKDRLCKVFIDKFEELERKEQIPSADLSRVYLLGVDGLPGSGKSTLCACLCDHFLRSFAGRALHLKLPTDPTPTQLMEIVKQLLKLTDFGPNREKMMSEIEDLSQMYHILNASNLRSLRVFLAIDNISSQDSIEAVETILRLGVGAGSRVMLVARSKETLRFLLHFLGNHPSIHYVCDSLTVPSMNETEATCFLMQSAGGLGLASKYSQKMEEECNHPISHRGVLTEVARMGAFSNKQSRQDLLYLPSVLSIIGQLLRKNRVDVDRQFPELNAIMEDFKEVAVKKIVEGSYQKLPEKLKLLFLDVALFMVPYGQSHYKKTDERAVELLGIMHESKLATIKRELNELMELGFLESVSSEFDVHDVFLEFAKSVPDASSMYYCTPRHTAGLQDVRSALLSMAVSLRALILAGEKWERLSFPARLSSVKVPS